MLEEIEAAEELGLEIDGISLDAMTILGIE
jgi:hypothetical protein